MSLRSSSSTSTSQNNASTPTQASRNPITLRLRKILGTSFTDQATIEALQTLSELYSVSSLLHLQQQRDGGDIDFDDDWSDLDSKEHHQQQQDQPQPNDAVDETASLARKNMRRDLEKKLTQGSQHFLKAFGEVDQVCSRSYTWLHSTS